MSRRRHQSVPDCLCAADNPEIACRRCGAANCPRGTECVSCGSAADPEGGSWWADGTQAMVSALARFDERRGVPPGVARERAFDRLRGL